MIKAVNAALKAKAWTFEANFIGPEVKATAMALRTTQWLPWTRRLVTLPLMVFILLQCRLLSIVRVCYAYTARCALRVFDCLRRAPIDQMCRSRETEQRLLLFAHR